MNTPPRTYDPKLRLALEEIKAILKRHDIMVFFHLGSLTHGGFMLHTDTSWSVVKVETPGKDGRSGIRIKAKGKVGTKEHEGLEASLSFICNSADICNRFGQVFYGLKMEVARQAELTHTPLTDDQIFNDDRGLQ